MIVRACPVPASSSLHDEAAKADFCDCYEAPLTHRELSARDLYLAVFSATPGWFEPLLALRDALVKPFGLKATHDLPAAGEGRPRLGLFPLLSETPDEVVVGAPDRHLDFRIALTKGEGRLTLSTLVTYNRPLGRVYLALIKPFHVMIVRRILENAVKRVLI